MSLSASCAARMTAELSSFSRTLRLSAANAVIGGPTTQAGHWVSQTGPPTSHSSPSTQTCQPRRLSCGSGHSGSNLTPRPLSRP